MVKMSARLAKIFRRNVRERMDAQKITQAELAEKLKVTPSFVSQMLSGHRAPGLSSLEDFARALDAHPSELIAEKTLAKSA